MRQCGWFPVEIRPSYCPGGYFEISVRVCDSFPCSSITNKDGVVTLELSGSADAQTYINGTLITTATVLHHVSSQK